ncbi:MAG: hypothetical protein WCO83_02390 [Alphaproteobacteria bacterium]
MMGLTEVQAKAKAFLADQIAVTGISPSYQQIADHLGLVSKSGVNRIVQGLEERGHIRRLKYRVRSIEVMSGVSLAHVSTGDLLAELQRRANP